MNGTWTWQIPFSLLVGLGGFLAVLLPVLVIQYSRYGRLSPARLLGTAALSVYAVALVAYTLLPLPDSSTCVGRSGAILRSEEHTSELQSRFELVCRLLLENKKTWKGYNY